MNNREAKEYLAEMREEFPCGTGGWKALGMAIKALEQTEWVTVNSPDDYPKESGDYLTVLEDTAFHNYKFTDITSFDCDGILAEWDLKPQYKVVAWKYFEPYKGDTE